MGQFARFGFRGRRKSFFMNVCVVVRARVCCAMRVRVRCDVESGGVGGTLHPSPSISLLLLLRLLLKRPM